MGYSNNLNELSEPKVLFRNQWYYSAQMGKRDSLALSQGTHALITGENIHFLGNRDINTILSICDAYNFHIVNIYI